MFLRRWVLWSFVLLMPFRLWAADAMALHMQMAPASQASTSPCHEHANEDTTEIGLQDADGAHPLCLQCDVCHQALSLPPGIMGPSPMDLPHHVTAWASPVVSAEQFPGFKPPIF